MMLDIFSRTRAHAGYANSETRLSELGTILREPREGIAEAEALYVKLRAKDDDDHGAIQEEWRSLLTEDSC